MNKAQRSLYFSRLWPEACKAQGWHAKDDERRKAVTLEATSCESATDLDEDGITALFDHLRWLADPYNLDLAMPVANPHIGWAANRRRQLIWRIEKAATRGGLSTEYLDATGKHKCARYKVRKWADLPLPQLLQFAMTVEARARSSRSNPGTAARPDDPF